MGRQNLSWTTRFRVLFALLFAGTVVTALVGWFLGIDPDQLGVVLMWTAMACGFGEASNVGKRATYKSEAAGAAEGDM